MYRVRALRIDYMVMAGIKLHTLNKLVSQEWDNVADAGQAVEKWYKEQRALVKSNEAMYRGYLPEDGGGQWPTRWAWVNDDTGELIGLLWLEHDIWCGLDYEVQIVPKLIKVDREGCH